MAFDDLKHASDNAPEGYALFHKQKARDYLRARENAVRHCRDIILRSDLTDTEKVAMLRNSPAMRIYY